MQFIRHGWIERNRILKQNEGWLYIKVPLVKHERDTFIKDVHIDTTQNWQATIFAQLQTYKKIAPYYDEVIEVVKRGFEKQTNSIVVLNKNCLEAVCDYLGIEKKLDVFSEMNLSLKPVNASDEWALNTCLALDGVDEYWNPPGGQSFFDPQKYEKEDIKLVFQSIQLKEYNQKREPFEPGLSVLDVLMFNSSDEVNQMIDYYEVQ